MDALAMQVSPKKSVKPHPKFVSPTKILVSSAASEADVSSAATEADGPATVPSPAMGKTNARSKFPLIKRMFQTSSAFYKSADKSAEAKQPEPEPKPKPESQNAVSAQSRWKKIKTAQQMHAATSDLHDSAVFGATMETFKDHVEARHRFMIKPGSLFRIGWDLGIFLLLVYISFTLVYRIGFGIEARGGWLVFETAIDAYFCLDVILNFRTSYCIVNRATGGREPIEVSDPW